MITLKTNEKKIQNKALVHDKLRRNLLSLTPIVRHIGAVILDRKGAVILPGRVHQLLTPSLRYFAIRQKGLYEVHKRRGAICMGAQKSPTIEARSANRWLVGVDVTSTPTIRGRKGRGTTKARG